MIEKLVRLVETIDATLSKKLIMACHKFSRVGRKLSCGTVKKLVASFKNIVAA